MAKPKFMWKDGSKWLSNGGGFWAALIIYNTANGIGKVEQQVGDSYVAVSQLNHLGNMYVMEQPADYCSPPAPKSITVRVYDVDNALYGEFEVEFSCGDSVCNPSKDASTV
jgi:hypothetical protein